MNLGPLRPNDALGLLAWLVANWHVDGMLFPCRRGHERCTVSPDYHCIDEAFEALAAVRRKAHGISAPGTPSGSIKAT